MNLKKAVVLFGFVIVIMSVTRVVFAQDAAVALADPVAITSEQPASSQKEVDMQWAWGEVVNLDSQAKTITLKYLDYETDQEKELVLVVDEKTTLENIKDFGELKLKDTLSVDYILGADNKNIAKNISFEKPDALPSVQAPAVETSEPVALAPDIALPVAEATPSPVVTTPKAVAVDSSVAVTEAPMSASESPVSTPVPAVGD